MFEMNDGYRPVPRAWTLNELMMGTGAANGGDWSSSAPPNATIVYKIGIYGWRKRCLYIFLLLLMITAIVNMALTIWILKVMDFSMHGMGKLRIVENGIRVQGDSEFLGGLYAEKIQSRENSALYLQSARNITLNSRNEDGKITNRLVLGNQKIQSYAKRFEIHNSKGDVLFTADDKTVFLGAPKLSVPGSGGAVFSGSVQTPHIRSDSNDLRLESPTRSMHISAPDGITLRSPAGPIAINSSLDDLRLESLSESIILDAKRIHFKGLVVSPPQFQGHPYQHVYQLCVCAASGKLFLSPSQGNCQGDSTVCG